MPNWCDNSLTVSHPDKGMMAKFAEGINNGNLFDTFIPMPEEIRNTTSPSEYNEALVEKYGHFDWYSWCVENWGTKWDSCDGEFNLEEDGFSGSGWFNTAWGPPIAAFEALKELGFSIDALYHECGMGFAGTWIDGEDDYIDSYYDLFEEEDWQDQIDNEDLRNLLEAEYESWLSNKEEEE
jgi:hypothetical protein